MTTIAAFFPAVSGAARYPEAVSDPLGNETVRPVGAAKADAAIEETAKASGTRSRVMDPPFRLILSGEPPLPGRSFRRRSPAPAPVRPAARAIRFRRSLRPAVFAQADGRRDPLRKAASHHDLGAPLAFRAPPHAPSRSGPRVGASAAGSVRRTREGLPRARETARREGWRGADDAGAREVPGEPAGDLPLL